MIEFHFNHFNDPYNSQPFQVGMEETGIPPKKSEFEQMLEK